MLDMREYVIRVMELAVLGFNGSEFCDDQCRYLLQYSQRASVLV